MHGTGPAVSRCGRAGPPARGRDQRCSSSGAGVHNDVGRRAVQGVALFAGAPRALAFGSAVAQQRAARIVAGSCPTGFRGGRAGRPRRLPAHEARFSSESTHPAARGDDASVSPRDLADWPARGAGTRLALDLEDGRDRHARALDEHLVGVDELQPGALRATCRAWSCRLPSFPREICCRRARSPRIAKKKPRTSGAGVSKGRASAHRQGVLHDLGSHEDQQLGLVVVLLGVLEEVAENGTSPRIGTLVTRRARRPARRCRPARSCRRCRPAPAVVTCLVSIGGTPLSLAHRVLVHLQVHDDLVVRRDARRDRRARAPRA